MGVHAERLQSDGVIDSLLDFLWRTFGAGLVLVFLSGGWFIALCTVIVAAIVDARVAGLTGPAMYHMMLVSAAAVVVCWSGDLLIGIRRIRDWKHVTLHGTADEVWKATAEFPVRQIRTAGLFGYLVAAPIVALAAAVFIRPGIALFAAIVLVTVIVVTALVVAHAFALPLMVRALLRGIGPLESQASLPLHANGFQWRLQASIPVVVATAACAGAWLGVNPGTPGPEILLRTVFATVVTVVLVIPGASALAYSAVRPLRDLIDGTERVKRGEFETKVPELAVDEFGVLASSFNEMLSGLADGQRLARENERLLGEVRASRLRIVAAADESRKRIERNIHDGAQQRLVALVLDLRMLEEQAPRLSADELSTAMHQVGDGLKGALGELRDLARGLHPAVLTTDGLGPAIEQLAARAPIPVVVSVAPGRFSEAVETACYFTVAEALANVAKYAHATEASILIVDVDGCVRLQVTDNGRGGADAKAGSGLAGLADRIAALDGTLTVDSPVGVGTTVSVEIPTSVLQPS